MNSRRGELEPGRRAAPYALRDAVSIEVETVSALSARIRSHLGRGFTAVRVRGEIGEWTRASSGHVYFSLKDASARLSVIVWRAVAARLGLGDLAVGTAVEVAGRIDVYAPRGSYSLIVESLAVVGRGDLHARFEALKAALEREGLFAPEHKVSLPFLPRRIGVVTSLGGAALHDFLEVLLRRCPSVAVVVQPSRVQGRGAGEEIAAALAALERADLAIDVIVLTRGGGSLEDLWAFNEEVVARAIHAARIPVVSAIGHEVDFTIADMVADERARTPTDAAVRVVPLREDLLALLADLAGRMRRALRGRLEACRLEVEGLASGRALGRGEDRVVEEGLRLQVLSRQLHQAVAARLSAPDMALKVVAQRMETAAPVQRLRWDRERLESARGNLRATVGRRLEAAEGGLKRAAALLEAHSPVATLAKGYSVAARAGSVEPLTSVGSLAPGDRIATTFLDGEVLSTIERIQERNSEPRMGLLPSRREEREGS